ncbi:hypothetical protein JCM11251_000284 [Rhodosporidiobolus azoricus]
MLNPDQELVSSFLLGTSLNLALFGIGWSQYVEYYRTSKDNLIYQLAAAFVFLIGSLHTFFALHSTWVYTVDSLVNPAVFTAAPWSFASDPLVTSVVAVVVQLSYSYRIFIVSKRSPWLPTLIVVLTALSLAFGILNTFFGADCSPWACINEKTWAVGTWLAALTASDIVITASLTYYLRRSRSEFEETNSLLDHIIRLTVQNNGLTAAAAITSAILFAASSTWHLVPGLALIKLYQISFFSALNSRRRIAADLSTRRAGPPHFPTGPSHGELPTFARTVDELHRADTSTISKRSHQSMRPGFLRSLSANDVRNPKEAWDHGADSLPVQVFVESTVVEDRHPDETWDAEKLMEQSRPPSPILGVNWQQLLTYQKESARSDRLFLRLLVYGVFIVTAVHTGCSIRTCWHYAVSSFGNPAHFAFTTWSFSVDPALTSTVALVVQLHYAYKVWTLSERRARVFTLGIILLSLFGSAWGIWCTWGMFNLKLWSLARTKRWAVASYLSGMAAADFLIATSFTYYLRRARGSFAETDRLVDQIVGLTVANNAFTAVVSVTAAVLFGANQQGWQIGGLISRLYCLSFYSALNARSGLRRQFEAARLQRENHLSPIPLTSATIAVSPDVPLPAGGRVTSRPPPQLTRSKSSDAEQV